MLLDAVVPAAEASDIAGAESLTVQQLRLLRAVAAEQPARAEALAERLRVNRSDVVPLIDRLARARLVAREPTGATRDCRRVRLLPPGAALVARLQDRESGVRRRDLHLLLDGLSVGMLRDLRSGLRSLVAPHDVAVR